ncbi:MAG: hypothetical protein JHD16_00395 [Solirubrobacteraceae bacterium]|nr:hypothetical protein [Solirubrobacteraceae bacterium]
MTTATYDPNDLAFWYPRIASVPGLLTPTTEIIQTNARLFDLLDGDAPDAYGELVGQLVEAAERICPLGGASSNLGPVFLRTGHGSGKHQWSDTCWVANRVLMGWHVTALVEWSASVGLPVGTWVVRGRLPVHYLFSCDAYRGLPVTREFRVFIEHGNVTHVQPYWPMEAVKEGRPDHPDWQKLLAEASTLTADERNTITAMAFHAVAAIGTGDWSVDFLQTIDGHWYLIDMAEAARSYRYQPTTP